MSETPLWILIVSITFTIGFFWVYRRAAAWGFSQSKAMDLATVVALAMLAGGRLLHVFYEEPNYYLQTPIKVLHIWEGGFVFYGGLALSLFAAWIWCERHDQNFWRWGDFFAPIFAFCYGAGRVACFFNSCCFGRVCDLPWAVGGRHPTQLYAVFFELTVMALLLWLEKRPRPLSWIFTVWLGLHGLGRLIMESFRDDPRGPQPMGLSLATWISISLVVFSCLRLILIRKPMSN